METTVVESWKDFMELSSRFEGWAFRGQQDARWHLQSSLSRYLHAYVSDKEQWRSREARAIRIFRRKAHNHVPWPKLLHDDLRCLGLMQHHGAPTRLLDFTKSPFVAAFFALERATSDSAIFALNTPALYDDRARPRHAEWLTRDTIDPRVKGNMEKYFLGNDNEVVWFGEPEEMDGRLIAQSGTLVVPGVIDRPLHRILDGYDSEEPLLRKIVLPVALRADAMKWLYRMNITNASLFPDLDGLARSIAVEIEMVWPTQTLG
ncbi:MULTISPECIES: FRG domain-containing protein [Pandoraea]|uniref:FRG domain-containing protein n=1 Tax=Pandoraea capi TaxID=2508286 RepID=A0ABY6VTV6_9BURK|nr:MULTISPECIES: FRG domain-containing protein [Pandoraea]MCI3207856.1 FRG domain-containing protein [Pandoraea sp. LA3]MDN4585885.1 FRG domain-containing protein [Pandoraea capi]VVD80508.1 FRG domain-containing protein [Pandoraea capi]